MTGTEAARDSALEEVKARVRDDVIKNKAADTARQRAAAVVAQLKGGSFDAAAKAAGLESKTTDLIARGAPIGDAGISPAVEAVAFTLPAGAVSDPIQTDNGAVIVKVVERKDVTPDEIRTAASSCAPRSSTSARNRFFSTYMSKAREKMRININNAIVAQIVA